jgi:hypothetical protein
MAKTLIIQMNPGETLPIALRREAVAFLARCERSLEHARQVGRPAWFIAGLEECMAEAKAEVAAS